MGFFSKEILIYGSSCERKLYSIGAVREVFYSIIGWFHYCLMVIEIYRWLEPLKSTTSKVGV
jgi:hypothetical protein